MKERKIYIIVSREVDDITDDEYIIANTMTREDAEIACVFFDRENAEIELKDLRSIFEPEGFELKIEEISPKELSVYFERLHRHQDKWEKEYSEIMKDIKGKL